MTSPRGWSVLVGTLTAAVLVTTVKQQIFDTNFYSLWEATALLAGDHPYRDFFEWGIPLQAGISALVQRAFGYRLFNEFVMQWAFLVAGAVIAFRLSVRLSRSIAASMAGALLAWLLLADTPIYHYPKLFFYPLGVLLAWRYLDTPTVGRAAAMGLVTALAFLFRHDHGIYVGVAAVFALAFGCGGGAVASWRDRSRHGAAFAAGAAVLLVPWLALVHDSEGLVEYVKTRYELAAGDTAVNPFRLLLDMHPIRLIGSDVLDPGSEAQDHARLWIEQVFLLVPLVMLIAAMASLVRHRIRRVTPPPDLYAALVAAGFLAVVDYRLFREASYAQIVGPLTAAVGAASLRWGPMLPTRLPAPSRRAAAWHRVRWTVAGVLFLMTMVAAGVNLRHGSLSGLVETVGDAPRMFRNLMARPPIEAFVPQSTVDGLRPNPGGTLPLMFLARYVHDCTRGGDRVLVTGSTPFDMGYLVERPIAGGHLYWHKGWRSDERHEAQSLAMLRRQSVPFALATSDPVLQDLKRYPKIHEYFRSRYTVVEGSGGFLLVEAGRRATGRWALGLPCFK